MVSILKECGIEYYAVATLREAIEISDLTDNVLLFETLNEDEYDIAYRFNFILSLTSEEYIDSLINSNIPFRCHLKIDVGMNRYGISAGKLGIILDKIKSSRLKLEGIYTHFGQESKEGIEKEYKIFEECVNSIDTYNLMIHCSKSNALFYLEDRISTHCRPGLCLYGISSIEEHRNMLKPIMELYVKPTRVDRVYKGETLGYDNAYRVESDGYAITLDYGYGDGLLTKEDVLYMKDGKICEINRRCVCMDSMLMYSENIVSKDTKFYFVNEILSLNYYRDLYGYRCCELSTRLNRRIERFVK
jgi:alanine racemase